MTNKKNIIPGIASLFDMYGTGTSNVQYISIFDPVWFVGLILSGM